MPTPLYTALRTFAAGGSLRMHMPGHKGHPLPVPELSGYAALDFTELEPTGDLFSGGGVIGQAESLWADVFSMAHCLFLTGGSTQGVHAALTLSCRPGDTILLDRSSHRAAYHALALLDLNPIYLRRPWHADLGVEGIILPSDVEHQLTIHPNTKTVCITSPSYCGVISDIPAISHIVHSHGGKLIVDGAHGAHLPFLGDTAASAADLLVVSAHKTLPAPGQSALLFARDCFSHADMRRSASLYGSSSPSYPMMAALDAVRDYMEHTGTTAYRRTIGQAAKLRGRYPSLRPAAFPLDPGRLVILCPDGFATQRALERQGIFVEMADRGHIVCILTCEDSQADLARLEAALDGLSLLRSPIGLPPPPPLPEQVLSHRAAYFSHRAYRPLLQSEGRISAGQIAPYPPGVPIVAPGERIEKKTIAYLDQIGYNMEQDIEVVQF